MNRGNHGAAAHRAGTAAIAGAFLAAVAAAVAADRAAAPATAAGPQREVRLECVADTAIFHHKGPNRSSAYDVNYGAAEVVPFHGIHYRKEVNDSAFFYLADFDAAKARGLKVSGGTLHLRLADLPDADKLRVVSVSTVSTPWNEGKGTGQKPEAMGGGATANWAVFGDRRWADPQSELIDATFGLGHSLYRTVEVRHEKDNWVAIDVPAEIAQALVSGGSSGLALFEEKGQTNIVYRIRTRESADRPYLVIRGSDAGTQSPPAVRSLKVEPAPQAATLGRGAVRLSLAPAEGTHRLEIAWRTGDEAFKPLEHWRTPWPGTGATSFVVDDLPADQPIEVTVTAVGPGGAPSEAATAKGRVCPSKPMPAALAFDVKPNPTGEPRLYDGRMRVWAYPDCEAVHPVSGNLLEEVGPADFGGKQAGQYRRGNTVWNGRDGVVTLAGARNEIVAFNLAIEAVTPPLGPISVVSAGLRGPGGFAIPADNMRTYRLWYVQDKEWKGDLCVPLDTEKGFSIPNPDNKVPGQRNQSIILDLWIPRDAPAGSYRGAVVVAAGGITDPVQVPVQLEVWPLELPDELSFNCELNAYSEAALAKDRSYYRMAHAHRTTLNVLPYSQNGSLKALFDLPLEGEGASLHVADWSKYDMYFGPLLDGTDFAGQPRAGVPLASQYLPFNEAWPVNFRKYYAYKGGDLAEHALVAGPIESMMDPAYGQALQAVVRDWAEHFRKKGWTRTQMQFFLNNKAFYTKGKLGYWTLDEPQHRDDFLALRYWGQLFKAAVAHQQGTQFVFRADISRPHLQREWFDGLLDTEVVGSGPFFAKSRHCQVLSERGMHMYPYGSLNPISQSNLNAEAWPLAVYLGGGEGLVPWDTIGRVADIWKPSATAILVPPPPGAPAGTSLVASVRLKALRRGQQDVEYLALLGRQKGYDREQVAALLAGLLDLKGRTSERFTDEAGETTFRNLTSGQFARLRGAVAARLAGQRPAASSQQSAVGSQQSAVSGQQ